MRYLEGRVVQWKTKKQRQALIGQRVRYLRASDIDRSGRGYFFPKSGQVTGEAGRNIFIDGSAEWALNIVEMVAIES